jgi:hypothetical protein
MYTASGRGRAGELSGFLKQRTRKLVSSYLCTQQLYSSSAVIHNPPVALHVNSGCCAPLATPPLSVKAAPIRKQYANVTHSSPGAVGLQRRAAQGPHLPLPAEKSAFTLVSSRSPSAHSAAAPAHTALTPQMQSICKSLGPPASLGAQRGTAPLWPPARRLGAHPMKGMNEARN